MAGPLGPAFSNSSIFSAGGSRTWSRQPPAPKPIATATNNHRTHDDFLQQYGYVHSRYISSTPPNPNPQHGFPLTENNLREQNISPTLLEGTGEHSLPIQRRAMRAHAPSPRPPHPANATAVAFLLGANRHPGILSRQSLHEAATYLPRPCRQRHPRAESACDQRLDTSRTQTVRLEPTKFRSQTTLTHVRTQSAAAQRRSLLRTLSHGQIPTEKAQA